MLSRPRLRRSTRIQKAMPVPDAPDDAEAGGDRADAEPGGAFLVEEADDEADEGGLEGSAGGGESADGDGQEDGRGEGCDGGSGA